MLAAYETRRRTDVATRTAAVDLLNRSLLTGFLPVQAARALGLGALASMPVLRHALMREGWSRVRRWPESRHASARSCRGSALLGKGRL